MASARLNLANKRIAKLEADLDKAMWKLGACEGKLKAVTGQRDALKRTVKELQAISVVRAPPQDSRIRKLEADLAATKAELGERERQLLHARTLMTSQVCFNS